MPTFCEWSGGGGRANIWAGARFFGKYLVGGFVSATLFLAPLPAQAQELRLSSASGVRGGTVTVRVDLNSPSGREPSALEWEIRTPQGQLAPDVKGAAAGKSAQGTGKELHCAAQADGALLCLVAGGREKLANGPVALLTFTVPVDAILGRAQVRLVRGAAVLGNSEKTIIPPAEAWVEIESK